MSSLSFTLVLFIDDDSIFKELFKYGECIVVFTQVENSEILAFSERTGEILGRGTITRNGKG
ncbi:hypothetical protein [Thermococcus sp.]